MAYRLTAAAIETTSPASDRRMTVIRPPAFSQHSFVSSLIELAQYRDLLLTLTIHRIKVRYKQSILGISWAILQPVSMMIVFTAVFSLIARIPSGEVPYPLFAYVALLPWNVFSGSVSTATGGLVSHSQLITKVYFPREILPITYVLATLFDALIASSVLGVLMFYYRVSLTAKVFYVIPIVVVLTLFSLSISLIMSATQVRFRDIGMAMPLLLQLWMFATPILYSLSSVPTRWRVIYELNPLVTIVEGFRRAILFASAPDLQLLSRSALVSFLLLVVSYLYFKRIESTMADTI